MSEWVTTAVIVVGVAIVVGAFLVFTWRSDRRLDEQIDQLETDVALACAISEAKDRALEALEGMVTAHLGTDDGDIEHWNLAVNMYACDVLALYLPTRWRATERGLERVT